MGFLPWPLCEVGVVLTRSPLSANIGNALTRTDLGKDKSRGGPLFWDSRVVSEFQERCSRGLGALGQALSVTWTLIAAVPPLCPLDGTNDKTTQSSQEKLVPIQPSKGF